MHRSAAWLALWLCLVLTAPALAQQLSPLFQRVVPGSSLAGIELGRPIDVVLGRFGSPSVVRETAVDTVYAFNRLGIMIYARAGVVTAASSSSSLMRVNENLGVGFRAETVTAGLGGGYRQGTVEGFPGLIYDATGIAFGLDRQAVAVILVFRPGTADRVSGLLPGVAAVQPPAAGIPFVAGLRPFSAQTNFMSLAGYLRWLVFQVSGNWMTRGEAERIVREQQRSGR